MTSKVIASVDSSWKERVIKGKDDLAQWTSELSKLELELNHISAERNAFSDQCKNDKASIIRQVKHYHELIAQRQLEESTVKNRRQDAERRLLQAKQEYDVNLHSLMRQVQQAEHALSSREVPSETLERESAAWAEEEFQLREQMKTIEKELYIQRECRQQALEAAEAEADKAEAELRAFKAETDPSAGLEPFSFPDNVVRQFPDYFVYDNTPGQAPGTFRKGRSASGRILGEADSNVMVNNNNNSRLLGKNRIGRSSSSASSKQQQRGKNNMMMTMMVNEDGDEDTSMVVPQGQLDEDSAVIDGEDE